MKKYLKLPKFKNEDEERDFWANIDLTDYFEPSDFARVSFPNLKIPSRPISIRLPEGMLDKLRQKASSIGVPYQTLIKKYIAKGLNLK
ncbi:BrnA antitoxin family protein [candidate division WWE3 bacterium]|nr:BrnA antitoxin family protein [candidate division WWE3 bacterium]